MLGGGVSHLSQLTTGLVIKSVTTSPTLAGERMLFYSAGKYSVGTNLVSDLIFQYFHSYMKKSSKSSDISLQHKNRASNKFSKKNFCTWPKTGLGLKGLR